MEFFRWFLVFVLLVRVGVWLLVDVILDIIEVSLVFRFVVVKFICN